MTNLLLAMLFAIWLTAVIFLRYARLWLFYYVLGVVGCAYLTILIFGDRLGLETLLAHSVAWSAHWISTMIGIQTRIVDAAPGLLLVLVIVQEIGWTVLHVGVESSGFLEISVLISLLFFYPGWSIMQRTGMILLGGLAIWIANILRMIVIVILLSRFGKEALVLAHMYVGKAFFFTLVIGIFWFIITNRTLKNLRSGRTQAGSMVS